MKISRLQFILFLLILGGVSVQASVRNVWAVNDGEKIDRDDLSNSLKQKNSVWDGHRIRIFGARNEIIAFQLIVESDSDGVSNLKASLPFLLHSDGKTKLTYVPPGKDPTDYVNRPIQLFSVNYLHVEMQTRADWVFPPDSPSAPKNPLGWKPVQLVPENAMAGRGGFPLKVLPAQNQAIWFEIYTRHDLPAGIYSGEITLEADGTRRSIPLELELFDFSLPDRNSMHAMVYYESVQPQLYHRRNLDSEYHRFAHRQRIELVTAYNESKVLASLGRFNGDDFKPARRYEGPGEGVGNKIIPLTFYGPGTEFDERERAWRRSNEWITFLRRNVPDALTFLYLPDEPNPAQFEYIRKLAANIHSNPGPGRQLPTFVTREYTKELDGSIDIWDTGPMGYDIARAEEERKRGKRYWIYNGGRPAAGSIIIDAPATEARATIWACFKHGIEVYYYWHGVHWRHNTQKQGERIQNVWVNPITFDNRGQPHKPIDGHGYINGDGVLMYPGEDKLHPDQDRGIAGPCSTIQLANFRRGLQDHQYLTMARESGLNSLVSELLQNIVPRVFSEAKDVVTFAQTGDEYEVARYRLARAIVEARHRRKDISK